MIGLLSGCGKSLRVAPAAGIFGTLAGSGRIVLIAVINIAFGVQAFGQVPALSATLVGPIQGVAADANGNVFVALPNANIVVRVDPAGILTVVIGPAGTLYIAESVSPSVGIGSEIRMVSNGVITTVAGGGLDYESDNIP